MQIKLFLIFFFKDSCFYYNCYHYLFGKSGKSVFLKKGLKIKSSVDADRILKIIGSQ